ncbi:hypothetical protein Esti_002145 [Eimeria stiedai]
MNRGKITSNQISRTRSVLPAVPQVPLLLHPHKPLLFAAHGSCMRLFDYEAQQWLLDELQQQQQQARTYLSTADNPLLSDEPQQQQQRHAMDVSAADCVCLACGSRSSNFPVYARVPCSSSSNSSSSSSSCLWITTGDDKLLCLWTDETFKLLQRRMQRKKASAVCFIPTQQQHQHQRVSVLLCDKFGDVFLLPLESLGGQQRLAGDVLVRQMKSSEGPSQQRSDASETSSSSSSSNSSNSSSELGQERQDSSDDDCDEDIPVMAHLATVTCLKLVSVKCKEQQQQQQRQQQQQQQQQQQIDVLITGDRDEKVRVCFASSPWSLEAAHLGHKDFVTDVAVITLNSNSSSSSSSSSSSEMVQQLEKRFVVSAAADCCLRLWALSSGRLQPHGILPLNPEALFSSSLKHVTPVLQQQQQQLQEHKLPAVLRGHLLPVKLFADEVQRLLVVQTLQLQGLLLVSYNCLEPQQTQQQQQEQQQRQQIYGDAWVVPLVFSVGAALVCRHSQSEIEALPIFSPIRQQQQQQVQLQQVQQQDSVLIAWLVDTEGRLQPPVCLELTLLTHMQQQQQQQQADRSILLPLLQGLPPPTPQPEQQQQQQQRTCYWWKQTRDPEAPTCEERRAKRLRHKHLQQQQQQEQQKQQQK